MEKSTYRIELESIDEEKKTWESSQDLTLSQLSRLHRLEIDGESKENCENVKA